eukprot:4420161-Amphidinium_carterae.1
MWLEEWCCMLASSVFELTITLAKPGGVLLAFKVPIEPMAKPSGSDAIMEKIKAMREIVCERKSRAPPSRNSLLVKRVPCYRRH